MSKFCVIMPAAGKSRRFHDKHYKKPFASLDRRAVWLHSAEKFLNREDVTQLILVIAAEDREDFQLKFAANVAIMGIDVVDGGAQRSDSIEKALAHVKPDVDYIAIHDAARPCIVDDWIETIFDKAKVSGAAIFATPIVSTIKRVDGAQMTQETVPRDGLWAAQTPQVFRRQLLLDAYAQRDGFEATDDAQLVERTGQAVTVVEGSSLNLKITTKEDLRLAAQILKVLPKPRMTGTGNPFAADDMFR